VHVNPQEEPANCRRTSKQVGRSPTVGSVSV